MDAGAAMIFNTAFMPCYKSIARFEQGEVAVAVHRQHELPADERLLSGPERAFLARQSFTGARRRAWIRGRVAVRRASGGAGHLLAAPGGAPRMRPGPLSVSLSHAGPFLALALARTMRVAVDLALPGDRARLARVLSRLGVQAACEPTVAWAALECALKLRELPIGALLGRRLAILAQDGGFLVRGIAPAVVVHVRRAAGYTLAWAAAR